MAEPITPTPTPTTPAPGAAPAAPVAPAPSAPAAAAPPGTETPPGAPAAIEPKPIPYPVFRAERARAQAAVEAARASEQAAQEAREQLAAATVRVEAATQDKEDLDALLGVIQQHPELRDAILERFGGKMPVRRLGGTPVTNGNGAAAQHATLDPADRKALQDTLTLVRDQSVRAAAERQEAVDVRDYNRLTEAVTGMLRHHGHTDTQIERLRPLAIRDIIAQAAGLPDGGRAEDTPYLFNRWYEPIGQTLSENGRTYVAAKAGDTALPASPPGGAPVQTTPETPALIRDKGTVKAQALAHLRDVAGWGRSAA